MTVWDQMKKTGPGKGVMRGTRRQIVVRIDDETYDEIRDSAAAARRSMAGQLRLLIEWGLEAEREGAE